MCGYGYFNDNASSKWLPNLCPARRYFFAQFEGQIVWRTGQMDITTLQQQQMPKYLDEPGDR
jgi:hypothetical protein